MRKIKRVLCTRRTALLGIAGAIAEITGCGGGGTDVAGLSSGGTGSFTSGTISGFGSIIVNGIRYNDDNASVLSRDDSNANNRALELGMVVNIEGSAVTPAANATGLPTATAYRITYGSEWIGPVSNKGATTFEVLGHTVDVLATTFFGGDVLQFADLTTAHFVEIYGFVDQVDGHIQASRIQVSLVQPTSYKLSGAISQINAAGRSANLGLTAINWSSAAVLPAGTADGSFVRVRLNPIPSGAVWTASQIELLNSPLADLQDDHDYEAEVRGSITSYQSSSSFIVNGIPVNAASARITGTLAAGVVVTVEGNIRVGQLTASKVKVITSSEIESEEFKFKGVVRNVTSESFEVVTQSSKNRIQTLYYDISTENRDLLKLTPLPYVEVKASLSDGRLYAFEIDLED